MTAKRKAVEKAFEATLERMASNLGWVIIRIPFDVSQVWGVRGRLHVKGKINGFAFRTSLFPTGRGSHFLLVNKRMQVGGHARAGVRARFQLAPDRAKRQAVLPAELATLLDEERAFRRWYEQLSYSIRKWLGEWIVQVQSSEARVRRAEQIAERLLATMEAERELPPVLKAAFARDPRAYQGWQSMTPAHRRSHLLGIFYYRTPEARARRVAKMLEEASERADKATRGAPRRVDTSPGT